MSEIPEHRFLKLQVSKNVLEQRFEKFVRLPDLLAMSDEKHHPVISAFTNEHLSKSNGIIIYGFDGENTEQEIFINDENENIFGCSLTTGKSCEYMRTPADCYEELIAVIETLMPDDFIEKCNYFQEMREAKYLQAKDCNESESAICNLYVVLNDMIPLDEGTKQKIAEYLSYNNSLLVPGIISRLNTYTDAKKGKHMLYQYGFSIYLDENNEHSYDLKIMLKCFI